MCISRTFQEDGILGKIGLSYDGPALDSIVHMLMAE